MNKRAGDGLFMMDLEAAGDCWKDGASGDEHAAK